MYSTSLIQKNVNLIEDDGDSPQTPQTPVVDVIDEDDTYVEPPVGFDDDDWDELPF